MLPGHIVVVPLVAFVVLIAQGSMAAQGEGPPVEPISVRKNDWPWWRGQNRDGSADPNQNPPLHWSDSQNILWSVSIPGRGHGSPIVVGSQVLLATADHESEEQIVLCYDKDSGEQSWSHVVHKGGLKVEGRQPNEKASMASSTLACDGKRLFINFLNDGRLVTSALTRDGRRLWQSEICGYVVHQGYGASPTLHGDLVIVTADNKSGGAVAALHRGTGQIMWKRSRPKKPNYSSPIVLRVAGKDQLVLTGCDLVTSLDPLTGETHWEIEGATTECVTTPVAHNGRIISSGGYPDNHIAAVAAFGGGGEVWRINTRAYVPSLLVRDDHVYATLDAGIALCMNAGTGEEVWKARLAGTFSSSPVLVGEYIYATNEEGMTFIFKATADGFQELATNKLGESVFATPAICGGRIYTRVAHLIDGRRHEVLYCIGEL